MVNLPTSTLVLRNYPDDDALKNPAKYSKAMAFSPDIIPTYGNTFDKSTLVNPRSLRGFTGSPIVGGDVNNVYIRGFGSGGPHIATLRVLPSELILWPQAWYNVQPVPSGPVVISTDDTNGPCVSDGPLQFRPPHTTGSTYSLVANVVKHVPGDDDKDVPPPPFDLEHLDADEFLSFLSKDQTFTFYNVIVADPTLKHVLATTRLRMFGRLPTAVAFHVDWHKGTPMPPGLEVSLLDDRGRVAIPRSPLSSLRDVSVMLESSYDAMLVLHVFAPASSPNFEPYTGFTLQVFKHDGDGSPSPLSLLGALNVIFEPHSTRNIRFASPAARQLKEHQEAPAKVDSQPLAEKDCRPIPVTRPAATGWWTRAFLRNTNKFPHKGPIGYSPDIQPVGTNLSKRNFVSILQNPALDYSTNNHVELVGNDNNYFFLRGHSTIADIDVQSRLFAVGASTANHPSRYLTEGLKAQVFGGGGTLINHQSISVAKPNHFYLFEQPFEISKPPRDSTKHYCLIAEVRQKRKCSPVYPGWPSDHWDDYATAADFHAWVLSNPLLCWRNINWEPGHPGGKKCWEWSCSTQLCIPDGSPCCSFFTIIVECDNASIPPKSTWSLVCDDDKIFPNGTCFNQCPISGPSPAFAGCHFAGVNAGYTANLTLTVTWCDDGKAKIPPPSIHWRLAMTETPSSPIAHLAADASPGSANWPFYVTNDYPYIGNETNPSPLPSFPNAGLNPWPYDGAEQFILGQVSLAATRA